MMKTGKRIGLNPMTGNIVVRKGDKFFEITREIAVSKSLLFLIQSATDYAVFLITDDGATLTPYSYNVGASVAFMTPSDYRVGNVIQSIESLKQHKAMLSSFYSWAFTETLSRYGTYLEIDHDNEMQSGLTGYYLNGLRNSYEPSDFGTTADVFNESMDYLSNSSDLYLCSGRKNWMTYEDRTIKNLELWDGAEGIYIKYDDEAGAQQESRVVEWPDIEPSPLLNVHAILSPTKYIGKSNYVDYYEWDDIPDDGVAESYTWINIYNSYEYVFGDVVVDWTGAGTDARPGHPPIKSWWRYVGEWYDLPGCDNGIRLRETHGGEMSDSRISTVDYDCNDSQSEFILGYVKAFDGTYGDTVTTGTFHVSGYISTGSFSDFMLAYKVPGYDLVKIQIASFHYATTRVDYSYTVSTYEGPYGLTYCTIHQVANTTSNQHHGQRVNHFTCKHIAEYLTYSYTLEDIVDGTLGYPELYQAANWSFNRRVLGMIHIATNTHTVHTVNDTLLTDMYSSTFTKESAAAIGLHRT